MSELPNPITLFLKMLGVLFGLSFVGGAAFLYWLGVDFSWWEVFRGTWEGSVSSVGGVAILYLGLWLLFRNAN